MGLPIKHRKKYVSHKKKWDKQTILEEADLVKDYALKNKKEIRKIEHQISKFKSIAKTLNRNTQTKNSEEAKNFIQRLKSLGFLPETATLLDEILDITLRDILDRRLSNIIYKHKLARSASQARQFIVHGHVMVNGKTVTSPSYSVPLSEEATVQFKGTSTLADENHPERSFEVQGMEDEKKELEQTPLVTEHEGDSDKREEALDNEEQDEVKVE